MLQRDAAASGDAGELHIVDHQFVVEQHGCSVTLHRDVEAVPLADWFVEALLGLYAIGRRGYSVARWSDDVTASIVGDAGTKPCQSD